MSFQTGGKNLEEILVELQKYFDEDYYTEITIIKNEDGEWNVTFDK